MASVNEPRTRPPTMLAATCRRYGPPANVRIESVARPEPRPNEVLVRIRACTVSSGDARVRALRVPRGFGLLLRLAFGVRGPRQPILGTDLAGTIAAVGSAVTAWRVGDEVLAQTGFAMGGHAEYRTLAADGALVHKPPNVSFDVAAALPFGGATACYFLRDRGHLRAGERLLVLGGSGAVGSAAIQLARHFGADVTATASAQNLELLRELGAAVAIDSARPDALAHQPPFDVVFDTVGALPVRVARRLLTPAGRLLLAVADLPQMLGGAVLAPLRRHRVLTGTAPETAASLQLLADLAAAGHFRPLIDRCLPLGAAAEAHALVDTGRKRGSVVLQP